jgi:hypothetical protein
MLFQVPTPPSTPRTVSSIERQERNPRTINYKHNIYRNYYPRRVVPFEYQNKSFGTYYSSEHTTYDLFCLQDYYNWEYKLCPKLKNDKRPIWK